MYKLIFIRKQGEFEQKTEPYVFRMQNLQLCYNQAQKIHNEWHCYGTFLITDKSNNLIFEGDNYTEIGEIA